MQTVEPISTVSSTRTRPVCTVIAGPNGAGKTTFALVYLKDAAPCDHFINADLIAAKLSPDDPNDQWLQASRILLNEGQQFVNRRESFALRNDAGRPRLPENDSATGACRLAGGSHLFMAA